MTEFLNKELEEILQSQEIKNLTSNSKYAMIDKVVEPLKKYLYLTGAYSIGAPSLNIPMQAFLINTGLLAVDPRILIYGAEKVLMTEYCPLIRLEVDIVRPSKILAAFTNYSGLRVVRDLEGIEARYFQHECDKLSGIDFRTRASQKALVNAAKRVLH